MKPVNVVLEFADWFSNKWRQVSYNNFLTTDDSTDNLKTIPQPSDTRWLFYRDVIGAILSQRQYVEQFALRDREFPRFWAGLRRNVQKYGPCVTRDFSFSNNLINATFGFTHFILDILGRINTVFQERYATVTELWDIIVSLKMKIHSFTVSSNRVFPLGLECLSGLSDNETDDFRALLTQLKRSLEMRFPCPSMSVDMRRRQFSNYANNSQTGEQPFQPPPCSVWPLLRFFSLPHDLITNSSLQSVSDEALQTEVQTLSVILAEQRNEITEEYLQRRLHLSRLVGIDVSSQANLFDVFSVVGKQRLPLLWREMMKIDTIFATTVTCEQCFSVMKHTIHVNMKCDTLTAKVINKLHDGKTIKEC